MDGITNGFSGMFSGKGLGMLLAVVAVLVVLEKINYAPSDLATKIG